MMDHDVLSTIPGELLSAALHSLRVFFFTARPVAHGRHGGLA